MDQEQKSHRPRLHAKAGLLSRLLMPLALAACWASDAAAFQDEEVAVQIYALYAPRVGHIQTIGTLYNGETEVSSASGLLIGDRLVITNSHAIPPAENYQSLRIEIRMGGREAEPYQARLAARDEAADLAALEIDRAVSPNPHCPTTALVGPARIPIGSKLYVLGFPLDQELSITDGLLSNRAADLKWQTSALLNKGNSGGPVFSAKGHLLGIASSGIVNWRVGDRVIDVDGVNFFIPADRLARSPLQEVITRHASATCWRTMERLPGAAEYGWAGTSGPEGLDNAVALASNSFAIDSVAGDSTTAHSLARAPASDSSKDIQESSARPIATRPALFSRSYSISQMKDDHPGLSPHQRSYSESFRAASGYLIDSCLFSSESANRDSDSRCEISNDRKSATFRYKLESGPLFDRWRGWIYGHLTLRQRKAVP